MLYLRMPLCSSQSPDTAATLDDAAGPNFDSIRDIRVLLYSASPPLAAAPALHLNVPPIGRKNNEPGYHDEELAGWLLVF